MNPGDDGVAISRVVETAASWDGAPLPSYPRGAPRVTILRATVPPHTALAMHTHALVNAGVILRGELTVIAETGAQRMFRPGEGIVELVGTRHYGENRGDGELELVMFYAGTRASRFPSVQTNKEEMDDGALRESLPVFILLLVCCRLSREFHLYASRSSLRPCQAAGRKECRGYEYMYGRNTLLRRGGGQFYRRPGRCAGTP